jgi:hypothetical protein
MAPPPNCSFCFSRAITRVIKRGKERKQLDVGAIADEETGANNAIGNGPCLLMGSKDSYKGNMKK